MIMTTSQMWITIAVVAAGTVFTRFLPYIAFPEGRKIPPFVQYLGKVLGPAVFGLLVVYCLRSSDLLAPRFGIPEIAGVGVTGAVFVPPKQMMIAMAAGTAVYMILVQAVF